MTVQTPIATLRPTPATGAHAGDGGRDAGRSGWLARLGAWTATHLRFVLVGWLVVLVGFGFFAPHVESALAGAGWTDASSQSVAARTVIQKDFAGFGSTAIGVVVHDQRGPVASDPVARATVARVAGVLRSDPAVSAVQLPLAGASISRDGRTVIVVGGAKAGPNTMVKAADRLAAPLARLATPGVSVELTGDSALWSQFNTANRSAMLRSEVLSWPVTMIILVIAFGSLVAAGLPLMLTMAGLLVAAGALVLSTKVGPVSIWALNFALMFALALGIDYALFLVVRFRAALTRRGVTPGEREGVVASVAETMDTAGKAVAFSAVTVLLSLSAVLFVPSPAFRSMALGIMLSVVAVLAATLTLLPAVLGRLGLRINAGRVRLPGRPHAKGPAGGQLEGRLHAWGSFMWRHPYPVAAVSLVLLGALSLPLIGFRTSMPSITIIPATSSARIGYQQMTAAFGPGAPGTLDVLVPVAAGSGRGPAGRGPTGTGGTASGAVRTMQTTPGVAAVMPGPTAAGWQLVQVVPVSDPSSPSTGATIKRLRADLPAGTLVGGAAAENYDLQQALASRTPLVFGLLLGIGFLMLLIALGAPLLALAGVLVTALSVAGAFGVARLIFQNGFGSHLLNFAPQGFVDAWGPIFFGAMVMGVAMDYTLFLLSAAKEQFELHSDPEHAMVSSVRTSGRVVVSAAAVMVAVFLTFALSGPLAPKEMGVILAVAVILDAAIVRLALLPVILRLGGRKIWHRHRWLHRVLPDVRFSH